MSTIIRQLISQLNEMSTNIAKLDNIFEVLYQDHSYFLTYPTISKSQKNKRTKNHIELARFFNYSKDEENAAATKIKKFISSFRQKKIFRKLKYTVYSFMRTNPALVLRRIDPKFFSLFEKDKYTVVFRLAGESFPPYIVYKIFGRQYVISSYNFPVREARHDGSNRHIGSNTNGSANNHPKKHDNWRICYVYRHDKPLKRSLNIKSLNGYRKNTHFITWITDKYGC